MKITTRVQKQFVWEVTFDVADNIDLIESTEAQLISAGLKPANVTPASSPSVGTVNSVLATPTKTYTQSGNSVNNINQGGEMTVCPLHKQPMDRITSKGTPYHSYKGKNCSGTGFWGDKPQQ